MIKLARALGISDADKAEDFITALDKLMNDCGVGELKMSDYGISPDEFPAMMRNAREMGGLFSADPTELSDDDIIEIYKDSYK